MTTRRIIPDAYTEYEDGHLGVVPPSLANVEAKIGAADGGQPGKVYTLSGPDAKNMAKTIFKGGPLLHAIEEAFDAGSTRIHAVRLGGAQRASITCKDITDNDVLTIKGDYGTSGNNHWVNVSQAFEHIIPGYAAVFTGPNRVIFYDENMETVREVPLPPEIGSVVGVETPLLPDGPTENVGFVVLGFTPAPGGVPTIWGFNGEGELLPDRTLDLSPFLSPGETITGLVQDFEGPNGDLVVTTATRMLFIEMEEPGAPFVENVWDYTDFGLAAPDISSACFWMDLPAMMRGEESDELGLLLERTAKKIVVGQCHHDSPPSLLGEIDLTSWVGDDIPEGIAADIDTGEVLVALRATMAPDDRILRLEVDWNATPNPTAQLVEETNIPKSVKGLGYHIADAEVTTTVTIQDRNESPVVSRSYEGTGTLLTSTPAVARAINEGGVYEAELLTDPAIWLMPSLEEGDGPPDPTHFDPMTGGADPGPLTNGDYLNGLAATVPKTDTAWIHAVGANTNALWTAILLHCNEMFELHHAERFAILETPEFSSAHDEGGAEYLSDLQDYVDDIVEMMEAVGDRNACVFAGGANFMDSDGNEYARPVTDSCGGTMAGLEVQKSLINKPVSNIIKLAPEFSPGHIQSLIQARVNCLRFKPGRGFIIAHSLTAAAPGSDYSRVNDLRAVYYGSKAAREAAQPYVGEENDAAGEGLRRLESAMSRPLEVMRDAGQIDSFDLSAVSTENDRLLGDVYVSLGIQPRRAMEMIYTTVYLK